MTSTRASKRQLTAVEALHRTHPLWCEVTLSVDFEQETLPLLFANDTDYNSYYTAMISLHPRHARVLQHLREKNTMARSLRADGRWAECLETLRQCIDVRRTVFASRDYQCVAAQVHLAWAAIHAATIAAVQQDDEASLADAHALFRGAQATMQGLFTPEALESSAPPVSVAVAEQVEAFTKAARAWIRRRMAAVLNNNWANYWAARRRWSACKQHMERAVDALDLLFPAPPCPITEPLCATIPSLEGAPTTVTVSPPPVDIFPSRGDIISNPHPLVMITEARLASCSARIALSESLGHFQGTSLLHERIVALRNCDPDEHTHSAGAAPSSPADLSFVVSSPNFDDLANHHRSDRSPQSTPTVGSFGEDPGAPLGGSWRILAGQPSAFVLTLATPRANYAAPLKNIRKLSVMLNAASACAIAAHLRDFDSAVRFAAMAEKQLVVQANATAPEQGSPAPDATQGAAATASPPDNTILPSSDMQRLLRSLTAFVQQAERAAVADKFAMPREATRARPALLASLFVRQDVIASREAQKRLKREAAWARHAVETDASGLLEEDGAIDPVVKRGLFQLPRADAERRTLATRASTPQGAVLPSVVIAKPKGRTRGSTPDTQESRSVISLTALAQRVAATKANDTRLPRSEPQQPAVDSPVAAPSSGLRAGTGTAKAPNPYAAADRALVMRQRELRAVLPLLDRHEKSYRDIVRELAGNEATLRKHRDAAARAALLSDAAAIAARGGMLGAWEKCRPSVEAESLTP